MKLITIVAFVVVGVTAAVGPAYATALSTNESTIDWNTLQVSPASARGGFSALAQYGNAWSINNLNPVDPSKSSFQFDWNDIPPVTNDITNTHSEGGASGDILTSQGSAKADGINTTESDAKGSMGRQGTFEVLGTGPVTFTLSLEYSYVHDMTRDAIDEGVMAATDIYFWLRQVDDPDAKNLGYAEARLQNYLFGSHPLVGHFSDNDVALSMQVDLNPGVTYVFGASVQAGVAARAPQHIPEPATLALVGLGLAGLGFHRRKPA